MDDVNTGHESLFITKLNLGSQSLCLSKDWNQMLALIIRIIIEVRHHLTTSLHVTKSCRPTLHVSRNTGAGTGQGKLLDDH